MRRLLPGWVVWTVLLVLVVPSPASAAPTPATCAGVWVVVDREQRCATAHATGEEALASAGFEVARSGGLICQIDRRPGQCVIRNDAYWSYWHAERRVDGTYGPWTYSTSGAAGYSPAYGDAEGWAFGAGKSGPTVVPAAGSVVPAAGSAVPSTAPASSTAGGSSATPTAGGSPATAGGSPATPSAGGSPAAPTGSASAAPSAGSPTGADATGLGITLAILAAGGVALGLALARRRRAAP